MTPGAAAVSLFLFAVLLAGIQYLIGESKIPLLQWPRERLPGVVRYMLACPACCGTWLGFAVGLIPAGKAMWAPMVDAYAPWIVWCPTFIVVGISGAVLVPVVRSLMALGWAVADMSMVEEK